MARRWSFYADPLAARRCRRRYRIQWKRRLRSAIPPSTVQPLRDSSSINYGRARVRSVLTGQRGRIAAEVPVLPEVAEQLRSAVGVVRQQGAAKAYRFMYGPGRIRYLGGAFFTKWLYFASAVNGADSRDAAPILDKQVVDWLNENAEQQLRPDRTASYQAYLDLLGVWGSDHHRTRVQVEQAIFELSRPRPSAE